MTQKEKELLLQDLCARLPYGVKVDAHLEMQETLQLPKKQVDIPSIKYD